MFSLKHFGSRLRFKSSRALDFSCFHEFCSLTETMDMTELLDAAGSSPESLRLEPKWLRDTYKRQISTDMKESLEAVDSSRVSFEQKSCDTSEYVGAVCNPARFWNTTG